MFLARLFFCLHPGNVLCTGRGRLDYVKQLVTESNDPEHDKPEQTNNLHRYICSVCVCVDMAN